MKLEQQVVSLELAKKMKELGFPQESLFYWEVRSDQSMKGKNDTNLNYAKIEQWNGVDEFMYDDDGNEVAFVKYFSAYTVAELGEMLPLGIATRKGWGLNNGYVMFDNEANEILSDKKEADARAKMLIYLAENNLINLKDITL